MAFFFVFLFFVLLCQQQYDEDTNGLKSISFIKNINNEMQFQNSNLTHYRITVTDVHLSAFYIDSDYSEYKTRQKIR